MTTNGAVEYKVIGLMSGTSLDGLDVAYCTFREVDGRWRFDIPIAKTFHYTEEWKSRLRSAFTMDGLALAQLNSEFGKFIGRLTRDFIREHNLKPDLIASHGHTVFHSPEAGLTLQIGSGAEIAAQTGITTVCDFRSQDVALGGQGAPLVPIGDQLLFGDYDFCLNLGGFSNVSFNQNGVRVAFDICPVNIALNHMSQSIGFEYDRGGKVASEGIFRQELFSALNGLVFYSLAGPKSLGREWFENEFLPILKGSAFTVQDQLRTVVEHIAYQIALKTNSIPGGGMLVTGGGAKNNFLIERMKELAGQSLIIPNENIVDFKEALIFAFLGLLRFLGRNNTLATVTGAPGDHSSGAIYLAQSK